MPGRRGNPNWVKGVSGNPGGKPLGYVEMRAAARVHTQAAIDTLVRNLNSPTLGVQAAVAILDRGYGRPAQPQSGEGGEGPVEYLVKWLVARAPLMPLPPPDTPPTGKLIDE